jgi:hypothetical protein
VGWAQPLRLGSVSDMVAAMPVAATARRRMEERIFVVGLSLRGGGWWLAVGSDREKVGEGVYEEYCR